VDHAPLVALKAEDVTDPDRPTRRPIEENLRIAAEMLADAVLPALRAGGPAEAVRIARRATRLLDGRAGRAKLSAEIGLGTALIFAGEYEGERRWSTPSPSRWMRRTHSNGSTAASAC
jgi:hypothetical protein